MKGDEKSSLFFVIFSITMKGKIYRVTYNVSKKIAELHMEDGDIKEVPMSEDEWGDAIKGDVVENFKKYLDE